jgi:hypothetical protein
MQDPDTQVCGPIFEKYAAVKARLHGAAPDLSEDRERQANRAGERFRAVAARGLAVQEAGRNAGYFGR